MNTLAYVPGHWEVLIVLFIILLLFGGKKLPELSRALGKSLHEFKRGREELDKATDKKSGEDEGPKAEG